MDLSDRRKQAEQALESYSNQEASLKEQLEQVRGLKNQALGELKLLMSLQEENDSNGAVPPEMAEEVISESE